MMSLEDASDVMPCLFLLHHGLTKKTIIQQRLKNGLTFCCSQLCCARKHPYHTLPPWIIGIWFGPPAPLDVSVRLLYLAFKTFGV